MENLDDFKEIIDLIKLKYKRSRPDEDYPTFEHWMLEECKQFLKQDLPDES